MIVIHFIICTKSVFLKCNVLITLSNRVRSRNHKFYFTINLDFDKNHYSEIRENGTRMFRRCLQEFFLNRDISVAI